MSDAADQNLLARCVLTSASPEGITAFVNGAAEVRPWEKVAAVSATIVPHNSAKILVLAIEFADGRSFVLGEVEPGWPSTVELLHVQLPDVEPFSSWGPRLIERPGVVDLFGRHDRQDRSGRVVM